MLLEHKFVVELPINEAWEVITDLPRVVACFPGAKLDESSDSDVYHGNVRIKIGPISAQYAGTAIFEERDATKFNAVISATGQDSRGQGTVAATIGASLARVKTGTEVTVTTDLAITGKVAQFGRGVIVDVSQSLLDQFQVNLSRSLLSGDSGLPSGNGSDDLRGSREGSETDALGDSPSIDNEFNLVAAVAMPLIRRAAPLIVTALVTAVMVRSLTGQRSAKSPRLYLVLRPDFTIHELEVDA